jgi:hypothetical protein
LEPGRKEVLIYRLWFLESLEQEQSCYVSGIQDPELGHLSPHIPTYIASLYIGSVLSFAGHHKLYFLDQNFQEEI